MPFRTHHCVAALSGLTFALAVTFCGLAGISSAAVVSPPLHWKSPARLRHLLLRSVAGTLVLSSQGVEFRSSKGQARHWSFMEIKTFQLTPRRLVLTSYENKGWHRPGDRQYHFHLSRSIPPEVAARLAQFVRKPNVNGDPGARGETFVTLPARHRTLSGGTNGILRFTRGGIDYITPHNRGARSWRWADIQTLAHPDPYHFTVGGYQETFDFELKQPMSSSLFDRLWELLYGRGPQSGS
jgi:hypothetical protein